MKYRTSAYVLSAFMVSACGSISHPEPKYKVTEEEIKQFILIGNNKEQCIHPELKGLTYKQAEQKVYRKRTDAEGYLWNKKVFFETAVEVLGESKVKLINTDPYSQQYFANMYNKFNNLIANVNHAECQAFKKEWKKELPIAEKLIKQAKQQALARKRQEEKEAKARQEFYATPQGQAYLAQQRMLAQQQQILAQQRTMQERAATTQALNQLSNSLQQINQNNMNMINQMRQNNQMYQMNRSLNNINNTLQNMGSGGSGIYWRNVPSAF
ncbi:DUF5358 domain-containing protein [Pasteurellaceae bacterium TAE3-ERU1]|nr:DUF5358 domain-containing protein [Pasteurellaceae bacterium TAE3-ERU1]